MPSPTIEEPNEFVGCTTIAEMFVATTAVDGLGMVQLVLDGAGLDKMTLRSIASELEKGGADEIAGVVRAAIPKAKLREPEWRTAKRKRERQRRKIMLAAFRKMTGKAD
jgi:hypothetical protein